MSNTSPPQSQGEKTEADGPQSCRRCGDSLQSASLLLVCEHNLCLKCAAASLENLEKSRPPIVRCMVCDSVTEVDPSAAAYLATLNSDDKRGRLDGGANSTSSTVLTATAGTASSETSATTVPASASEPTTLPAPGDAEILGLSSRQPCKAELASQASHFPPPTPVISESSTKQASRMPSPARSIAGLEEGGLQGHGLAKSSTAPAPARQVARLESPRPVARCGQCEERAVEFSCEQCAEVFCGDCANSTHQRGRMAAHQLHVSASDVTGGTPARADHLHQTPQLPVQQLDYPQQAPQLPARQLPPSAWEQNLQPLSRRFLRCPIHPEEPLNYFCMDCQSYCICAECVLHGEHQGHQVQCLREALQQLPEKVQSLSPLVRTRVEGLQTVASQARERRQEVQQAVSRGQEELAQVLKELRAALQQEEARILLDADASCKDIAALLDAEEEASITEAHMTFSQAYKSGDAVQALNCYGKLKQVLLRPPSGAPAERGSSKAQLKSQLSRGFETRRSSLAEVSQRIAALRTPSLGSMQVSGLAGTPLPSPRNGTLRRSEAARPPLPPSNLSSPRHRMTSRLV
mmetsp:Transcript_89666/g.159272  ORF Transcript_89666/g.159272 Transcript_89666/m.159272 type:complete len:578 (+) Transcript_89666:87-1820(+)